MNSFLIKTLVLFITLFCSFIETNAQKKWSMTAGIKLRVTNIYPKKDNLYVSTPITSLVQQPDTHFSGLGLQFSESYCISKKMKLRLHQTIRYDVLYEHINLPYDSATLFGPITGIKPIKRLIFDTYFDVAYKIRRPQNNYYFTVGYAACGLNTKHYETYRFFRSYTDFTDVVNTNDFFFPAITTSFVWENKKITGELKFGYCFKNPTWYYWRDFIFPELSLQYKIF